MATKNKNDNIDFEIKFVEGLLQKRPHFLQALILLGDLYTRRGLYLKGLEVDLKLVQISPEDPYVFYNLACSYSLVNDIDKAFVIIKKAISKGYDNFYHLESDEDLANLRNDQRFQRYIQRLKNKRNLLKDPSEPWEKSNT